MNEKIKSPSGQGTGGVGVGGAAGTVGGAPNAVSGPPQNIGVGGHTPPTLGSLTPNNGGEPLQTTPHPHPYGAPPPGAGPGGHDPALISHYPHHLLAQPHPQPPQHPPPPHMPHQPPQQQQQQPGQGPPPPQQQQQQGEHPVLPKEPEYGHLPPPPSGHHPVYGRYPHADPNIDPYRYSHAPMQQPPPGGKPPHQQPPGPGPGVIGSPGRPPPQRYIPGQPPQGPTPTLNSLLQSSHPPPPPQHRYANSYDPQQAAAAAAAAAQQHQQQQQNAPQPGAPPPPGSHGPHGPPPPQHQPPYAAQQGGWAPPPRPYSPQLGPSQQYRTPPPTNTSRGQSPYPPAHGQNSGSYPSSPQQQQPQQQQAQQPGSGVPVAGGGPPPPPQTTQQNTPPPPTSQYSPYPQRYPTPPGLPATGPNHRTAYSTHQYPEPNRPWPGGSSPAPSPGPGGHPMPPASPHHVPQQQQPPPPPPHATAGGPPPSSSPGHAPSPSPQPSQASPSPHQELMGQNSNDSSSGGAHSGLGSGPPGTPNPQQVMRPTPSPTGSSGSRSMSPAVAQSHPISRPASNQSSSGTMPQPPVVTGPAPMPMHGMPGAPPPQQSQQQASNPTSSASNSPQQTPPPPVQQPPPPNPSINNMGTPPPPQSAVPNSYPLPPHMHGGYKMAAPGQSLGAQGYPPQQPQQYPQGNYPPRPQYPAAGYPTTGPPPTSQVTAANNMQPGAGPQQYPGRPVPNHTGGSPHAQYPPYQSWVPPSAQIAANAPGGGAMGNHVQGKNTPPPVGPPPSQGSGSPRPLNYLKQHLQHKGGYGGSPTPPQGYGNGPGMHPSIPMGPPHHMGPPHGPTNMGPPASTPPQSMPGGPISGGSDGIGPEHISHDNGISSSGSLASGPHPVTSVITTGPDGTPIDEVSQQSTLSNASAASGEDPQCTTPKSRKNDPYGQGHLAPPSTSPSGPHTSLHPGSGPGDEYDMNSPPNWSRPPASPQVFNSHVPPQEPFRTTVTSNKKSDSLCKLYEMDDNPERRGWLDKLRSFMEERRTPITACPTISKQPLDLYRLYIYVKERGGFVEVTKSKTWKDIAGLLGIGASSSAAYTLRKHYTKNLLAFECHFDRGDIDPLPIIQQVEAGTKKKTTKAASVPSPGSSNSQDSFPASSGAPPNATIDSSGYPGYPPAGVYPGAPGTQPDYGAPGQMQRPPSQSNTQTSHAGNQSQTAAVGDNISVSNPFDDPVAASGGANVAGPGAAATGGAHTVAGGVVGVANVPNTTHMGVHLPAQQTPPPPSPMGVQPQSQQQQLLQQQPQVQSQAQQPPPPPSHTRTTNAPYQQQGNSYPTPVSRTPGAPYPGQPGTYGQYGSSDQYNTTGPPGQPFGQSQGQYPPQNRNMYPPYGPEGEAPPSGANQYGPYGNRPYSQTPPGGPQPPTQPGTGGAGVPPTPGAPGAPPTGSYVPPGTPTQQDYYRPPDQSPQPRRHPDFVKDSQPYPGYSTRPQIYGGWQGATNQYRPQYAASPSPQQWGGAPPRTQAPPGGSHGGPPNQQTSAASQWEQHRYPPQQAPPPQQQQPQYQPPPPGQPQQQPQAPPQWAQMNAAQPPQPGSPGVQLRPPMGPGPQQQRMPAVVGPPGIPPQQQSQPQQQPQQQPLPQTLGQPNMQPTVAGGMVTKTAFSMPPPSQQSSTNICAGGAPVNQILQGPGVPIPPGIMPQKPTMLGGPQTQLVVHPPQQQQQQQQQLPPQSQQAPFVPPPGNAQLVKKEIVFPPDSVEATTPVLYRRKRLTKADVCPIDPWRIFMSMRSGLLTECTWALDMLNVLLFDDTTVQYFGLSHLPGLLTLLLEHFQKNLAEMFVEHEENEEEAGVSLTGKDNVGGGVDIDDSIDDENDADSGTVESTTIKPARGECLKRNRDMRHCRGVRTNCSFNRRRHYEYLDIKSADDSDADEGIDLGQMRVIANSDERFQLLSQTSNFTLMSRKGIPVRIMPAENDIFVDERRKSWDIDTCKLYEQQEPIGSNAWTYDFTEPDALDGIIDVFKSEFVHIPFARFIRSRGNKKIKVNSRNINKLEPVAVPDATVQIRQEETSCDGNLHTTSLSLNEHNNKKRLLSPRSPQEKSFTTSDSKKSKLSSTDHEDNEAQFVQPTEVKKEMETSIDHSVTYTANVNTTDSDCREVDMEIEAPQQQQQLTNGDTEEDDDTASVTKNLSQQYFDPKTTVRDAALVLNRRRDSTYEDECYTRDEASLHLVNESQDSLARRCIAISNIFRNLTFVPGNETVLAKSTRFLALLGRLLLLNHEHLQRTPKTRNYDREEDTDFSDSCSSLQGECEWWWEYLIAIRENMLVAIANIAGHLELARFDELIARPLIDGLLHWAVCPSAHAQDPFPSVGPNTALSPQRLALEALCKLCVTDANVDLVIATPPFSRLEKLCAVLTRHLCRNEDQVLREFSVNLLHYLAAADSAMARTVALQSPCISYLVAFIEQAEQTALGVANQHGINYLRENPDSMGTSLDMLRRAAGTLLHLAKHLDNRSLFMQQEQRLLGLVMSHILDQQVALIISRVLFQVSRGQPGPMHTSMEHRILHQQHQRHHENLSDKRNQHINSHSYSHNSSNSGAMSAAIASIKAEIKSEPNITGTDSGAKVASLQSNAINATDESSNSSTQQLPPAATFNDVSNSSTNSNSCSTASSNLSNSSSVGSNSHTLVNANSIQSNTSSNATIEHSSNSSSLSEQQQHLLSGAGSCGVGAGASASVSVSSGKSSLVSNLGCSNLSLNTTTSPATHTTSSALNATAGSSALSTPANTSSTPTAITPSAPPPPPPPTNTNTTAAVA